jgi:hypothetical protein
MFEGFLFVDVKHSHLHFVNKKIVGRLCKSMVSFPSSFFVLIYSVGKVISVAMHKWVSDLMFELNLPIIYCFDMESQ